MKLHHQRSHIHDGLKHLSDRELVRKVREAPTKLKKSAKSFLYKLRKYGVQLDDDGELDLSDVRDKNVRKFLTENASLTKLTLMQADLEFEYPQKLEKMLVKADVVELANKEEEKLQFAAFAKEAEEARRRVLTYEEYFQLDPTKDGHVRPPKKSMGSSKGDTTYEQFLQDRLSDNMFANDLMELEYKFWESAEDKKERIKKMWIGLKKKNALGGDDMRSSAEQNKINREITDRLRKLRWRVDQELTVRNIDPVFKENYYSYDKDEFLIDADFEFVKVRNLLEKNPRVLREDPIISIDYMKIINLIKQKKLLEQTTNLYDPTAAVETHWFDVDKIEEADERKREQLAAARAGKDADAEFGGGLGDSIERGEYEKNLDNKVKNDKKAQAKEQLKIIKQFDTLAEQFKKTSGSLVSEQPEKKETAGMIKRKDKKKKEKTLAAKLRLKAKKNK